MDFYGLLSVLSGLIFAYAFYPYIRSILNDPETKPALFSWILWAALDIITFIAMKKQGGIHLWLIGCAILGASVVALLSLKYGERKIEAVNIVCTILVAIAIVLQVRGAGLLSLLSGLLGLIVAAIPTIIKSWQKPETEDRHSWVIFVVSSVLACLAVNDWRVLGDSLPPTTFLLIDVTILSIVLFRPKFIS